jgi:RNA polymerase sigma-70 factor (ECF subfamily)
MAPLTQPSLLVRIRDVQDSQAWSQFVEIYAPLVYAYARKHGFQDADAADVTQDVLRALAGSAAKSPYDPKRGSFRAWLFTVVRNKLRSFLTRRTRHCRGSGDSAAQELLEAQPAREAAEAASWDHEYEQRLFTWAAEQVRGCFQETTWQAFWQTAVEGAAPRDVARKLRITAGAVYIAKSRVLARLREQIRQVLAE